jgi:hypothetical protein
MALTKEEFEEQLKVVYDNLTLQQFELLLNAASNKTQQLISSGDLQLDYISKKFDGINEHTVLSANVWVSVKQSRRVSFKQFKSLSWFGGINWLEKKQAEENEFKQF